MPACSSGAIQRFTTKTTHGNTILSPPNIHTPMEQPSGAISGAFLLAVTAMPSPTILRKPQYVWAPIWSEAKALHTSTHTPMEPPLGVKFGAFTLVVTAAASQTTAPRVGPKHILPSSSQASSKSFYLNVLWFEVSLLHPCSYLQTSPSFHRFIILLGAQPENLTLKVFTNRNNFIIKN